MCVVLGVGVISVFDAVAFLACAHRVSSFGAHREGGKQFQLKLEQLFPKGFIYTPSVPRVSLSTISSSESKSASRSSFLRTASEKGC